MKQVTTIKVTPETSQELKGLKKEMRLKSKEEVILKTIENNKSRIDSEKNLISSYHKKIQESLMESDVEEPEIERGIVENVLTSHNIKFLDKNNTEISIVKPFSSKGISPEFQNPYIIIERFLSKDNLPQSIKNIDFVKLKQFGFQIGILTTKYFKPFYRGQRVKYVLFHNKNPITSSRIIDYVPTHCAIQYDLNNKKIRIKGKQTGSGGYGSWLNISSGSPTGYKNETKRNPFLRTLGRYSTPPSNMSSEELAYRTTGYLALERKYKKVFITDIPIMLTEDNQILCLPKSSEAKHIGVSAMTGTCKSLLLSALLSWEYWLMGKSCVNLNDLQKQTLENSFPTDSWPFNLKVINAKPIGLPMVYIWPSTSTLQINKKDKRFPHLQITLPLREIIENIELYYKLDKSKVYLGNLTDELVECDSFSEMMAVIEEAIPQKHTMMKFKIKNIFMALERNKMIDVSVPQYPSYLKIKGLEKYPLFPIQIFLMAGIIPSFQTSNLRNEEYFASYMSFIVDSIYKTQFNEPYFKDKVISLFVDEIDKIFLGHNGDVAKKSLSIIGTTGRSARIGLRWSTQNYGKVPDAIRNNSKYLFVSRLAHAREVREIEKDFAIPKHLQNEILTLKTEAKKGNFELIALTTENFVLYNLITGEKTYSSEAHKGRLITPLQMTFRPDHEI